MHSEYTKVFAAFDTSVYDEYHDRVFSFFSQELGERRKLETIKNLKKKLWEYVEEQNDDPEYPLFEQPKITKNHEKKINETFNSCLKNFEKAGFISVTLPSIESLQPEFISNFPVDIIHIKKSQERGVRWLIYYHYMNRTKKTGKFSIPLTKLENGLKDFKKIKNFQKLVEKLVLDSQDDLDIEFHKKTKSISFSSLTEDIEIGELLSGLEEFNRSEAGSLEQKIINTVEYQPFANKEIVNLTGADKGHVSKVMKKLNADGKIIPIGRAGNFQYWLTNCDNCPFRKTKADCWDETSESIQRIFKDKLGIELDYNHFEGVDNHILRNLNAKLQSEAIRGYVAFSNRNSPSDNSYLEFYDSIFNTVLNSMKSKNPNEKLKKIRENLPRLYSMGFSHALKESRKFEAGKILELMEKVGISPGHIDKFTDEYIEHVDKIDYK